MTRPAHSGSICRTDYGLVMRLRLILVRLVVILAGEGDAHWIYDLIQVFALTIEM